MIYIDLPTISNGSVEQQLLELRSYVYKSNEQLNATLSNLTIDKIWAETANSLSASSNYNDDKVDSLKTQYQKVRDLIIKTADSILQTDERWNMALNGSYLAKSQFGEYLLETSVEIDGSSTGFKQLYTYSTELGSDYGNYKLYQQNFIKQGLLDDSSAEPIYGIDVGLLTSEFEVDGKVISVNSNKKLRITPDELSLWSSDFKVAYINSKSIYFPSAVITGGSINIGNGNFRVDSKGNLIANSGKYYGELAAESITASLNTWSGGCIELKGGYLYSYYNNELKSRYGGLNQIFYNDSGGKIGSFGVNNYGTKNGIGTVLQAHTGTFITIAGHYETNNDGSGQSECYTPDVVWSSGDDKQHVQNNIYPEKGLHIATPCYFHNSVVRDINVENINLKSGILSQGYTTKTGKIWVRCSDSGSEENSFWAEMTVRSGLITALHLNSL